MKHSRKKISLDDANSFLGRGEGGFIVGTKRKVLLGTIPEKRRTRKRSFSGVS
jgi:hypothetical protein